MSLAVTSYQTGQLILLGALGSGHLSMHERNFVRAMGVAASSTRLYLATVAHVWRLENVLEAGQVANVQYDALYFPRAAFTTGDVDVHELAVQNSGQLIFVNTKYCCLSTLSEKHSFKPLWKPSFVTKLAPEDRCHLNGLALRDGHPRYVTAASRTDVVDGWREARADGGILIDIQSDRIVVEGLSMPHSPRYDGTTLWVLDSGNGFLCRVSEESGRVERVTFLPGFLRGMGLTSDYAVVGTSLPRNGAFKGLPLDGELKKRGANAKCGIFIVNLKTGDIEHWLTFESYIMELFDVSIIEGVAAPMCVGLTSAEVRTLITIEN